MHRHHPVFDFLLPRRCAVCRTPLLQTERQLCAGCLEEMPLTYFWDWRDNPAEKKLWGRTYLERVVCLFFYSYDNAYPNLLYKVKYHRNRQLGLFLGKLLGEKISSLASEIDCLVPVPLHPLKKWKRGYNQSEIIAQGIAAVTGLPVRKDLLRKIRHTRSQTGMKMEEKWRNVCGAFVRGRGKIGAGSHILLVDDVLTSGATVEACCSALSAFKDIKVSVATIAYVE